MLVMVIILVGFLFVHMALAIHFHLTYKKMIREVHAEEKGSAEKKAVVGPKWAIRCLWALQINLLFICFHFGFYLTHTRYILKDESAGAVWHIVIIICFLLNIC